MIADTVAQFRRMRHNPRYCGAHALFYLGQFMQPTNHMLQTTHCTPPPPSRAPQFVGEFNDGGHGLRVAGSCSSDSSHPCPNCRVRLKVEQVEGGGQQLVKLWGKQ